MTVWKGQESGAVFKHRVDGKMPEMKCAFCKFWVKTKNFIKSLSFVGWNWMKTEPRKNLKVSAPMVGFLLCLVKTRPSENL